MNEALTVELRRGPRRESAHHVLAVVVDDRGDIVHQWGDADTAVHPRSSIKPIQALPLVETGAADALGCSDRDLALATASHNGEPGHVDAVAAWLDRIGCSHLDLECGVQAGRGDTTLGNNCSGKHAGFVSVAHHLGVDPRGYIDADHAVMRLVDDALAQTANVTLDPAASGIDGCGIPVHPIPLRQLALSAARFGAPPDSWHPDRRAAAHRLAAAMVGHPWFVAGTDRVCTDLLTDAAGAVVVKVGAEGVQWAAIPERGLGIAVKCVDGAMRASELALAHVLSTVEGFDRPAVWNTRRTIRNHAGREVGTLTVVG